MTATDVIKSCGYTIIDSFKSLSPMNGSIVNFLSVITVLFGILFVIMLFDLYLEHKNSFVKISSVILTAVFFVVVVIAPIVGWTITSSKEETQYKVTETKNSNPTKLLKYFEIVDEKSNNFYTVLRKK